MAGELSKQDRLDFAYHDGIVQRSAEDMIIGYESLVVIRDRELWRTGRFKSWRDYLERGTPLSRSGFYRYLSDGDEMPERSQLGTEVAKSPEESAPDRGTSAKTDDVPRAVDNLTTHARRALRQVPEEKKAEVLEKANEAADRAGATNLTTAEHIAQGIRDVMQPPVTDMEGNKAPQRLADIFDLAQELQTQISLARAISKATLLMAQKDGGAFIQTGTVKTMVSRLTREIGDAIPWAICPKCAGDGCLECGKRGWFTRGHDK